MIPKTIHYCWFGGNPKSETILRCIKSWKETCPDFVIKEWNESNFDIHLSPFTGTMYKEKRWAFVSDYARLHILLKEGGFYLDTDMLLLHSLTPFTENSCVLGEEAPGTISAGMIGADKDNSFIKEAKEYYDTHPLERITIPRALTHVFKNHQDKSSITVLPPKTFYPFDAANIHKYHGQNLGDDVYGVHLWDYSWGHPLNKWFKKVGIYSLGKRITEFLGIKKILKKILGFV